MKKLLISFLISFTAFLQPIFAQQFKVATLNCEWLSCTNYGPSDETLQLNNIAQVIRNVNADIIALQEVGTSATNATIDKLVSLLGNSWAGAIVPWNADNCYQNQAIIYKNSKVQSVNSSLITNGGSYSNWSSGRYPALYNVNFVTDEGTIAVSLINIHAKAYGDLPSYSKREAASQGLKTLLDGSIYNTKRIVLIGDFNDYLVGTQCSDCPEASPYKNFMDDTQNYKGLTQNLHDTYYNSPVIDNIVISNELFVNYAANSAVRDVTSTQSINNYRSTTSDHYPITVLLNFGTALGVSDIESEPEIIIYPNPATTELRIENYEFTINSVQISDIAGKIIHNSPFIDNSINGSVFAQGIYLLKIETNKGSFIRKFVKN
jgi:endonuclease/exonuclease/phosphatase family metal-dependent hydrolase